MNRRALAITFSAIIIVVVVALAYWLLAVNPRQSNTSPSVSPSVTPSASPSTTASPATLSPSPAYKVTVFFSKHPDSDEDPGKVFPVPRTADSNAVGTYALSELLKGPAPAESNIGYFSTTQLRSDSSNCGGKDFTLVIKDKTATLKFCKAFDHRGSVSDGQAESEIKATLMQFPTVKKVIVLNKNGGCEFNLSGLNLCKQ